MMYSAHSLTGTDAETIRMQNSLFEGTTNPDIFNLGKLPKIFRCRVKAHMGSLMPKINKTTMCVGLFLKHIASHFLHFGNILVEV